MENPGGRPTLYKPAYDQQARKLALLGAKDTELADFFEVSVDTINEWKRVHPRFSASIKAGKARADALVSSKLFQRACGYSHEAVKILTVSDGNNSGSHVEQVPYVEHYPPDTTAAIFWLKNRRPADWRDKQEVDHTVLTLSPEEREKAVVGLLAEAKRRKEGK